MAKEHKSERSAMEHLEQQMVHDEGPAGEVLGQLWEKLPTDPAIPTERTPAPPHDHSAASRSATDTRKHHQEQ